MAKSRRSSYFWFCCSASTLLLSTLCGRARAQAEPLTSSPPNEAESAPSAVLPMQPGLGMVRVHLRAGDRAFSVFFGKGRVPVAACSGPCEFWVWPGKYRVLVRDGEGPGADAQLALRVRRAGDYAFVPAHGAAQNTGLYLGVSGPVIGLAGLVFTAAGLLHSCDRTGGADCDKPTSFYVGLGALGLGVGMTSAGWLLYAANRAHFAFTPPAVRQSTPRVALISLPRGGVALGASFAF